jgi:hypothetical protein
MQVKTVKAKKSKPTDWSRFQDYNEEAITITKVEDSLFHIRAWKKDGKNFVPALETIYTSSQAVSPTHLGKVIQKVLADVKTKENWIKA